MPIYCFTDEDSCRTISRFFHMTDDIPETVSEGGVLYRRDLQAEHGGFRHAPGIWPKESYAAGVHPAQIEEAHKKSLELGVPTEFSPNGDAIFRDRAHRKRYLKAVGLRDNDAGYSD